ncbi:B4GALT1 [Branchiostoma lanceolatum]|uniref:B4GALT1 protein n=1 Tax=Branchiostoma lanceolatum TaxID=7740 RepID=A0A8K0EXC3_BRALA|nr:B4GALT1 [Branchiostoma lanceolatum]
MPNLSRDALWGFLCGLVIATLFVALFTPYLVWERLALGKKCTSKERVAILIPYRDREEHLKTFLQHMHPFLKRQQVDYSIYVIEQQGEPKFCRGLLFNIGFSEVMKTETYDCFIFHDVDLIPEDDRIKYSCSSSPRHLSVAVDKFGYRMFSYSHYGHLIHVCGGVTAFSTSHFKLVNGFSNLFRGWGGEDDDMFLRLKARGLDYSRQDLNIARYRSLPHEQAEKNETNYLLLKNSQTRYLQDGLNSLETVDYRVKSTTRLPLYTHITVWIDAK